MGRCFCAHSLFFHFAVDLLTTCVILNLLCRSSSDEALFSKMHAPFSLKLLNLCAGRPWGLALWLLPSVGVTECHGPNRWGGGFPCIATRWGGGCATKVSGASCCLWTCICLGKGLSEVVHATSRLHAGSFVLCFKCLVYLRFSVQWSEGHGIPLYLVREHVFQAPQGLWLKWLFWKKWSLSYPPHSPPPTLISLKRDGEKYSCICASLRVKTLSLNFSKINVESGG